MPLRFHWRLPLGGETSAVGIAKQDKMPAIGLPNLAQQIHFCRQAEECGIDSVLVDFGFAKPDPILLAAALGMATEKIKFIVAYRSGLAAPSIFVQQLNTLSALIDGRFSLNIVNGYSPPEQRAYGDFLTHDERYERTDEFLAVCHAFWRTKGEVNFEGKYYTIENGKLNTPFVSRDRSCPEIFIAGSSPPAQRLALRHGTCWLRLADTPGRIRSDALTMARQGIEVGLRLSVIIRPTREEASAAAYSLVANVDAGEREKEFVRSTDSKSIKATYELSKAAWLTPYLWTGAVPYLGPTALALVGAPADIANAILEYKAAGVSQFIFSGWPKLEQMMSFGQAVLPLIAQEGAQPENRNLTCDAAAN